MLIKRTLIRECMLPLYSRFLTVIFSLKPLYSVISSLLMDDLWAIPGIGYILLRVSSILFLVGILT